MIKHITILLSIFLLGQSALFPSNREYDGFGYIRKDHNGKYILITKQGDKYGVIDLFENQIIQPHFKYISYTQDSLFVLTADSTYGISDLQGNEILPVVYGKKNTFLKSKEFDLLTKDGKQGVFDRKTKKIIISTIYDRFDVKDYGYEQAISLNDPLTIEPRSTIVAYRNQNDTIKASLIDLTTGKAIIEEGVYDKIEPSDQIGYIVGIKDDLSRVVDYNGNVIIPFQKERLTIGSTGFISWGDCSRQFISQDTSHRSSLYNAIAMYNNGVSYVLKGNKEGVINSYGEEIVPVIYDNIYMQDKYIMAINFDISSKNPPTTYFFDLEGKSLFPPLTYGGVEYNPKSGLVLIRNFKGNEGLMNKKGKFIMPLKYRRIYIDEDAQRIRFEVMTKSGIKMGLADIQGRIVVKPKYDKIDNFIEGIAEVAINTNNGYLYGLINLQGQEILKPKFSSMFFTMDDAKQYAAVYDNNRIGVISCDGRITVAPKYDKIIYEDRSDDDWGDLAITKLDNLYGVVNINTGQTIVEPIYDRIFAIGRGDSILFSIRNEEGNYLIDKNGTVVIPFTKDLIYPVSYAKDNNEYLIRSQSNGKKGIISISNEDIIPPIYDNISQLNRNLFKVELDGKVGVVDKHHKILFSIEYDLIEPYLYTDADLLFAKKGDLYGYIFLDKMIFEPSPITQQLYEAIVDRKIRL